MTQFSGQITQLLQGVSQQHPKDRAEGQNSAQVNCISDIVEGLRRRPASKVLKHLTDVTSGLYLNDNTAVYSYSRGDGSEEYIILADTLGRLKVYDAITGDEKTVTNGNGGYLACDNARTDLKFHTIGDTTFVLNTKKEILMDSSAMSPALGDEALIYAIRASYGHTYTVHLDGNLVASVSTPSTVSINSTTQNKQVALSSVQIMDALTYGNAPGTWTVTSYMFGTGGTLTGTFFETLKGDVLYMDKPTGGAFQITVNDGNHGNDLKVIQHRVKAFEDLPKYAPKDYKIEIVGTGDERFDNYWVKWDPESGSASLWDGPGVWQECIGPGISTRLDPNTMPGLIKRKSDGTFEHVQGTWVDRAAGDDDTNPTPSFVTSYAQDIGSFKNRLYVLTEENVVMSRAFDELAFFAESAAQTGDDDPVDSASSDNEITNLLHSCIYNGSLVMFSHNAQFIHHKDDPVLPGTFAVSSETKFNVSPKVGPVVTGASIMFPTDFGSYTNVWEYNINTLSGKPQCESTTKHVPRYIQGNPVQMIANTTTDYVFVRTDAEPNVIYVNQFYFKDQKRAQLAWHKWEFPNCEKVISMTLLNQRLFLLVERNMLTYLEYIDMSLPQTDNSNFELYADHYYSDPVEYGDWYINGTEYMNRIPLREDNITFLIQGKECINEGFVVSQYDHHAGYIYCNVSDSGGFPQAYVIHGHRYDSEGCLTNPYVRDSEGRPYTKTTIIDEVTINIQKTGYVEFTIGHAAGTDYTEVFNGQVLNNWQYKIGLASELDADVYLPVRDYRELVTINFKSNHHLGFALMSMDWLAEMDMRGRRSQ